MNPGQRHFFIQNVLASPFQKEGSFFSLTEFLLWLSERRFPPSPSPTHSIWTKKKLVAAFVEIFCIANNSCKTSGIVGWLPLTYTRTHTHALLRWQRALCQPFSRVKHLPSRKILRQKKVFWIYLHRKLAKDASKDEKWSSRGERENNSPPPPDRPNNFHRDAAFNRSIKHIANVVDAINTFAVWEISLKGRGCS